jgi:hypothetical protein
MVATVSQPNMGIKWEVDLGLILKRLPHPDFQQCGLVGLYGAYAVSEADEFSLDAAVAPGGILLCQAQHQGPDLVRDR